MMEGQSIQVESIPIGEKTAKELLDNDLLIGQAEATIAQAQKAEHGILVSLRETRGLTEA